MCRLLKIIANRMLAVVTHKYSFTCFKYFFITRVFAFLLK